MQLEVEIGSDGDKETVKGRREKRRKTHWYRNAFETIVYFYCF